MQRSKTHAHEAVRNQPTFSGKNSQNTSKMTNKEGESDSDEKKSVATVNSAATNINTYA